MSYDKIRGLLTGVAVGDALGAPHEILGAAHKCPSYTGLLEHRARHFRRFQNIWLVYQCGQYTDDTEMSLSLARVLADGPYNEEKAIQAYLHWANSDTKSLGRNTRALFHGIKTVKGYRNRAAKHFLTNSGHQSNGALMRCAILATQDNWEAAAIADCRLSNPDPICVETEIVYLTAVRDALQANDDTLVTRQKLFAAAQARAKLEPVSIALTQAHEKKERILYGANKGWCCHGLYCAFYTLLHHTTYKEAIDWVINQGGDTDTNACITGALWGALIGFEKLMVQEPKIVQAVLECSTEETSLLLGSEVAVVRPKEFRANQLEVVAALLSKRLMSEGNKKE